MLCANGRSVGGEVGLREQNPFGHAGGTGGVHEQRMVLGRHGVCWVIGEFAGVFSE